MSGLSAERRDSFKADLRRVGKFGAIGVINTLLDFTIYNVLHTQAGLSLIEANIISTTCAMIFSFFANKQIVFKHHGGRWWHQAVPFFAATMFGLYVLQNGTITLLTDIWPGMLGVAVMLAHATGASRVVSDSFVVNNGAKAVATAVSLAWNYIIYKKVVFKHG
ncbi:MAG TPA: GtrA family protein [Candidatus Saccharimonadia bacterium]|nr:GtrA family protein [Candidatus Saccharimonadia bacterium]